MKKVELHKSIEARKLNRRSGLPLKDPPVMIPFAAMLDGIERERELAKFNYLGERYVCNYGDLKDASNVIDHPSEQPAAKVAAASTPPVGPPEITSVSLSWEALNSSHYSARRTKVPSGWLVATDAGGLCFYPDPKHQWTGGSEA